MLRFVAACSSCVRGCSPWRVHAKLTYPPPFEDPRLEAAYRETIARQLPDFGRKLAKVVRRPVQQGDEACLDQQP